MFLGDVKKLLNRYIVICMNVLQTSTNVNQEILLIAVKEYVKEIVIILTICN